jgi:putative ABC transport system substrate-binding protein
MRRREFVTLLGGTAAAWPLAARAQLSAVPVIGFLNTQSPESIPHWMAGFHQGLKETGFVEGQNVAVEYRWAQGQYNQLPELAADLVRRQVAVLAATGGEPSPQVAKAATQTIPIVFTANDDPVRSGLVASLNRPGGNATGITIFGPATVTKRVQLLHELVPKAAAVAYLMNPNNPNADFELRAAETAAVSLGKEMLIFRVSGEAEFEAAFATMVQQRRDALVVASDVFFLSRREQLTSSTPSDSGDLLPTRIRRGWRLGDLRQQLAGGVSSGRHLRRPDSQRREARRPACPTGDEFRTGDQSHDCQCARPYYSDDATRPR